MTDKPPYRKWVGVLLGFLIPGSAHFLSGDRTVGLKWLFGLMLCGMAAICIAAIPGTTAFTLGVILFLANLVLWFIMLKKSYRPVPRIGFLGWVLFLILSTAIGAGSKIVTRQFVHPFSIPNNSMSPTIKPGDLLLADRISYRFSKPERGDLAVFRTDGITGLRPKTFYVKRIAGLPGERIRIEHPFLFVNDEKITEPSIFETISAPGRGYNGFQPAKPTEYISVVLSNPGDEITLGPDEYFLLGDNTRKSYDSRYWGPVKRRNIIGKATRVYWPFNRFDALDVK